MIGDAEIKKSEKGLNHMIKVSEEMIPREKGILNPEDNVKRTPKQTWKIAGMEKGEAIPNKYLERVKEVTRERK